MCSLSFDFSILYTHVSHEEVINVLTITIHFVFKGGAREKYQVREGRKFSTIYTKDNVVNPISYLIKDCHSKLGDKPIRKDIGIFV